jgi:ferritin-like metal-binding protein YciE
MAAGKTLNERDEKLVKWLSEAHGKEAELETDLTAHISLTQKPAYKKRLQQHLKETRDHKRRVAARIKQLGGPTGQNLIAATSSAVGEVAGKTVAAVKGQVGAARAIARAIVTQQAETHLRNAQEEFREEHIEIALYARIEALATAVGDRETAQLARAIRREEERMAKYLLAEIERLVKDVVRADIPRDQRASTRRTRSSRSTSRSRARTSGRASASGSRSRSTSARSTSARSGASRSGSTRTSSRSGAANRTRARAGSRS